MKKSWFVQEYGSSAPNVKNAFVVLMQNLYMSMYANIPLFHHPSFYFNSSEKNAKNNKFILSESLGSLFESIGKQLNAFYFNLFLS